MSIKKEDIVLAADDLNVILFDANKKENGWIHTDETQESMLEGIKDASLWLLSDDQLAETTIRVLQHIDWKAEDFQDLKESQKPITLFQRYGIGPFAKEHTEDPAKTAPEEPKRPSAHGTALALMGPDPEMPINDLYVAMEELGFDLQMATGSIKTAHSIFRKCYRYLKEHGHIKETGHE